MSATYTPRAVHGRDFPANDRLHRRVLYTVSMIFRQRATQTDAASCIGTRPRERGWHCCRMRRLGRLSYYEVGLWVTNCITMTLPGALKGEESTRYSSSPFVCSRQ